MNSVNLVGRLTNNVDMRYTPNGKAVSIFTLAVARPYTNNEGDRDADFIRIVTWGKSAENVATYCGKGSLVAITGRINTRTYEKEGRTNFVTEVYAYRVQFLQTEKPYEDKNSEEPSGTTENEEYPDFPEDEVGDSLDISDDYLPF